MIATDINDSTPREMKAVVAEGVTSFKLFMAYPGVLYSTTGRSSAPMQKARDLGALICMHAENGIAIDVLVEAGPRAGHTAPKYHSLSRPQLAEAEGTHRAIMPSRRWPGRPCTSCTCPPAARSRRSSRPAIAACPPTPRRARSTCSAPTTTSIRRDFEGAKFVCTPPLRPKEMQEDLWRGLRTNDLQVVSTDHCPFCMKGQKELGRDNFAKIPNGMPGIETRLYLLWDGGVRAGRISMNRFVEITSAAPAKLFGLFGKKGTVAVGADADLLVWDPDKEHVLSQKTLHMRVDYSPFEGRVVRGAASHVLSHGKVVIENGSYMGKKGDGSFLRRSTFSL
jgi:dihydropyrimidinase